MRLPYIIELFFQNSSYFSGLSICIFVALCRVFTKNSSMQEKGVTFAGEYFERGFKSEQMFTVSSFCSLTILKI